MLDFDFGQNCYGCGACEYVCPKQAITLKADAEGFLMPVIDRERCIKCGLCVRKCTYLNPTEPPQKLEKADCFGAYRTDE